MDVSNAAVTNRCYRNTLVITLIAVFFFSSAFWAAAEVSFSAIRASQDNRILFNAETEAPGYGEYHTAFLADLSDKSLQQLTVFPERISLIANSQAIRIQNRFGLFRLDPDSGWFSREIPFPSFQHGDAIQSGKIRPVTSSPNGRFLVYLEQISPAYARLVMYDTVREQQEIITENMALTYDPPPVSWSPDSSMLIYSTQGELFYFSLQQYRNGRIPDQAVRRIGPGAIHNVQWGRFGSMYYVRGSLVYKILPNELFTRTLYQGIMSIGT
ncbi:MAG: polysaccharide deacetylase family protein, partial [Spirochaeta sp.]